MLHPVLILLHAGLAPRELAFVVERDLHLMANVRPGLRLIQVRSQARGIALIVVVDLQKMPGPGGGDR